MPSIRYEPSSSSLPPRYASSDTITTLPTNQSQTLTISIPTSFRSRFVTYGPRATPTSEPKPQPPQTKSPAARTLDALASLQVPHSFFTQFYVASVISSLFWGIQLLSRGSAFQAIATRTSPEHLQKTMSVNQVMVTWALMLIQGSRRLYECLVFSKPSSSKMWFVHWLLGAGFYVAVNVAVWIEGTGMLSTQVMVYGLY